jgi:hypothetical protein
MMDEMKVRESIVVIGSAQEVSGEFVKKYRKSRIHFLCVSGRYGDGEAMAFALLGESGVESQLKSRTQKSVFTKL